MGKLKMGKAQSWSFDVMIATVIFIGTILAFYTFLNLNQGTKADELNEDASRVISSLTSDDPDVGVVKGTEVNETKLNNLLEEEYSDIKRSIRVQNDFCVYFEDDEGNIILINSTKTGVGSGKINVSDIPCG